MEDLNNYKDDLSNYTVCKRCGALVKLGEKICPNCGKKMTKHKGLKIFLIVLLVILLALGGFIVYLFANYGDDINYYKAYYSDADRTRVNYKSLCHDMIYDELLRRPDNHVGDYYKFDGEVFQVFEEGGIVKCLVDVNEDPYSLELVCVFINNEALRSRVLDGDEVSIYGTAQGLYRYESVSGSNEAVPFIYAQYLERK